MAHAAPASAPRSAAINLRAMESQRDLIDRACAVAHKTRTDFMLDAACREAEHVLCDRRYFALDAEAFEAFEAALDAPVGENKAILELLARKAPWDD